MKVSTTYKYVCAGVRTLYLLTLFFVVLLTLKLNIEIKFVLD